MIILKKKYEYKNHYKQIIEKDFLEKNIRNGSILSISQWREIKQIVQEKKIDVAVEFSSGDCSLSDNDEISKVAMVQINFETFKDGRPFTFAKILRKKHNFKGELRAVGHILPDQFIFLIRCGFDSVEIREEDKDVWLELFEIDEGLYYQP
tara:strand:+ start:700 stop:1152 length:453 start_codon:yes stop_codon:yes gene_type:complete